jgi:hypothetical protein
MKTLIPFHEAFKKFIQGQSVKAPFSVYAYGDQSKPHEERFYGEGIELSNGYKMLHHGGGCSGEDCNTSFIVDNENNLVARENW